MDTIYNPTIEVLVERLVGKRASAYHPQTVLNPNPTFTIYQAKIDNGKVYVRGEHTAWFEAHMVEVYE